MEELISSVDWFKTPTSSYNYYRSKLISSVNRFVIFFMFWIPNQSAGQTAAASASAMGLRILINRRSLHSSDTAAGANTITIPAPQMLSLTSSMLIPEAFKPTIVLEFSGETMNDTVFSLSSYDQQCKQHHYNSISIKLIKIPQDVVKRYDFPYQRDSYEKRDYENIQITKRRKIP